MKKLNILLISALVSSTTVMADNDTHDQFAYNASMPPNMRDSMRQQWIQQNQRPPMPMLRGQQNGMMMDPQMMQNMMTMRQQGNPNMPHSGMMDPQMMHNMMRVHTDQMRNMEQKLARIESLLGELVDLQKQR